MMALCATCTAWPRSKVCLTKDSAHEVRQLHIVGSSFVQRALILTRQPLQLLMPGTASPPHPQR